MTGLSLGLSWRRRPAGAVVPPAGPISAVFLGQSEVEYLFNSDSTYRQLPQPVPGNGNLTVVTQAGAGVAPVTTVVNAASVAAGQVNPAMAALSAFLAHAVPGRSFVVGDGAVPGTSRYDLADDSTDATDTRRWSDLASVVTAVEGLAGGSVQHLIECWYNADAGSVQNFRNAFWPVYFGTTGAGAPFTLGSVSGGREIDRCLWDGTAAASEKGRGIFARSATLWHVLTPMPFHDAPTVEMTNFSENAARLSEPARATMRALADDPLAQSVGIRVGPSAHLCKFGGASTEIHPDTDNPDGQIGLMWPFAFALLRAAGQSLGEPAVVGVEGPSDGTHADLLVSLPNGGTLTTLRALRGGPAYTGTSPHRQAVTGIEITRGTGRRPVYRTDQTSYPAAHRGTVVIQSAAETHATLGRVGRVRITPEQPFAFGNALSYLRGQATAALVEPRDFDLYPDFLLEHVPALSQAGALYPCPGVAVRPFQEDIAVTVPAPAFTARSALFNGSSFYSSSSISVASGDRGLLSLWMRNSDTSWNAAIRSLFTFQVGSTITMNLTTASSGRMSLRLNNSGASDVLTFHAAPGSVQFVTNRWYHVAAAWTAGGSLVVCVDGVQVATLSLAGLTLDQQGQNLTRIGVGATSSGTQIWPGQIGHLWLSVTQTLDLSVAANRERFLLAGQPVNLGGSGELVTGTSPQWYYDGDAGDWNNKGTAGNVALTGALTAGSVPGL